jgi:hypothetical protein
MSTDASPTAGEIVRTAPNAVTRSHRRVLMTTCQAHNTAGFTNLLVTKEGGYIVLNPHLANCCVLRLDEQTARTLHGIFGEWLG